MGAKCESNLSLASFSTTWQGVPIRGNTQVEEQIIHNKDVAIANGYDVIRDKNSVSTLLYHHCTATSLSYIKDGSRRVRDINHQHCQMYNVWKWIPYSFIVDYDYDIWRGCFLYKEDLKAAHAGTWENNVNMVGIALAGCYDTNECSTVNVLTDGHIDALARIGAGVERYYNKRLAVKGHKDVHATACPGNLLHNKLGEIESKIRSINTHL